MRTSERRGADRLVAGKEGVGTGAFVLRSETELMLKSRRVIPTRLLQSGYTFKFPTWADAATDLYRRWRLAN